MEDNKILEYTFEVPHLSIEDGRLIVGEVTKETYTFTLLFKGFGLYQELTGKTLMNDIISCVGTDENIDVDKAIAFLDSSIVRNLACASYVKIEDNEFHNNRATCEEFKKLQVYNDIDRDYEFMTQLLNMAMACIVDKNNKKGKKDTGKSTKK